MRKSAIFAVVAAIGAAAVGAAGIAGAAVQTGQADPVTVQLNQDTAVLHDQLNVYQRGVGPNLALADCPGATAGATTFSSPVLQFSHYDFGPFIGVKATVSADANLVPGTAPGSYPLTVNCGGKAYTATFSVSAPQVSKVPAGAAKAGDGSLAD
ncbi:hypothetical protein [Amycolatopsis benzoatilytica]|uniref:hypothetical protein n=1 Tax=Amycolatopsis benzoatilytica TaxID=346045 RepID=UPI00037E6CA9|nr:hypothetical protein [Amycolatopsis benzoatilytica]